MPLFCATFVRIDYQEGGLTEEGQARKISVFQRLVAEVQRILPAHAGAL